MVNCHASIKGLFGGMIVFSCTVTSIILYSVFRNRIGDDFHSLTALNISTHQRVHSRAVTIESILLNTTSIDHLSTPIRSTNKTSKTTLVSIAIVEIVNLSLLIISLLATTTALIKIRKFQYRRTTTRMMNISFLL